MYFKCKSGPLARYYSISEDFNWAIETAEYWNAWKRSDVNLFNIGSVEFWDRLIDNWIGFERNKINVGSRLSWNFECIEMSQLLCWFNFCHRAAEHRDKNCNKITLKNFFLISLFHIFPSYSFILHPSIYTYIFVNSYNKL